MRHNFRFLILTVTALLLLSSGFALAAAPAVPGSAEPSRAPQQIAPLEAPKPPEGAAGIVSKGGLRAPQGAEKIKFKLVSFKIDGMTAYRESDISSFYKDMIGTTITLADVYDLANKLTAKYRNDGYILTHVVVPPQTIESGHVRLRVIEGFTSNIRLEGDTNGKLNDLQPYIDKIKAAHPFNSKTLERYLLLMNDLPGISAKAVLSPSKVPGATDILIVVSRRPYDVFFQADNRGSRFLGPLQLNAGTRLNNMLGTYEGINLQYALAPDNNELNYGSIGFTEPLDHEGTRLMASGSATRTRPGYTLEPFDVHGLAKNLNLEVMHPFIRSRNENLSGTVRFNYLDSHRADNLGTDVTDRLSVLRLGSLFQNVDSFAGTNALSAEISKGLGIFGSTSADDPNTTRPGADDKFVKGTAEISRLQRLTPQFDLFGSVSGQWAAEKLLTSEQFGLGGVAYGSAYDSSEITGDDGIAARSELRLNNPVSTPLQTTQVYTFYDIGKVWDPGNTSAADRISSLASAGVGLRLNVNQKISGSLELAKPLTRNVGTTGNRDPRLFAALTAKF
jgi:hemolysin activation/secretion protein